jgi:hypothetical protein
MFADRCFSYFWCKQKIMSFRGQASSAKMTSFGGKLTALACHPTKRVSKAEELTYLSTNIDGNFETGKIWHHSFNILLFYVADITFN